MQVQWEAVLDGVIIRLSARMDEDEYMAFGISGAEGKTRMIGADVTVAYFNRDDSKFQADDYYLSAKSQVDLAREMNWFQFKSEFWFGFSVMERMERVPTAE